MRHWLIVAAMLAVSLTGMRMPRADGTTPVDLAFMTSYGPNQSRGVVLQNLVAQFNAEHAGQIKVSLQVNPDHPAMQAKLRTMIAAGAPPDIFHYNFNALDLAIPRSGQLFDFVPAMDAEWKSRFDAADLARFTFDGKLVSIPFQQSPAMFYYNTTLFQKAGITQFPATWGELMQDCDKLQAAGVACVSLYTKNDAWHASNALTYAAACAGGLDAFTGATLDTPAMVAGFGALQQLFRYATKDSVGANYDVSAKNFLLGKTAMMIDGPWAIGPINDQFKIAGEIAVAKAPTCDGAKAPAGFIVTDAPSPMAAGRQKTQAGAAAVVAWFKFLTSGKAASMFAQSGSQPVAFKQDVDAGTVNPLFASYLAASGGAPGKVISAQRVLRPAAQTALPGIIEGLALGQMTSVQAAQQLQAANE